MLICYLIYTQKKDKRSCRWRLKFWCLSLHVARIVGDNELCFHSLKERRIGGVAQQSSKSQLTHGKPGAFLQHSTATHNGLHFGHTGLVGVPLNETGTRVQTFASCDLQHNTVHPPEAFGGFKLDLGFDRVRAELIKTSLSPLRPT
eukprot:Blabericola_migrator_1__8246@NODE_4273_length_1247_cov_18_338983_g2638_i0_p1_GENE_NODE_4273_length_1247_cov_18_338983_g2638_i0NODE_4273_length_1247_cov_18_338983_g2638_i0_p1_ORF_typecomplete_len146_score14_41_NODE_4273_length_1247_cov_18_338983_g2638_i022459